MSQTEKVIQELQEASNKKVNILQGVDEQVINGIPVNSKELAEISENADKILAEIKEIDIYSESFTETTKMSEELDKILQLSSQRKEQVIDLNSAFTKRNYVGLEESESKKAIDSLKETLMEYDPRKFNLTEPDRLLGFIPMPDSVGKKVRSYFRKFKDAEGHLNDVVQGVIGARDDGIKSLEELNAFQLKLMKMNKELKKQYMTFKLVLEKVEEHVEELKDRDPYKAKKLEHEVVKNLAYSVRDTLEVMGNAKIGIAQTEILIETQKDLVQMTDRLANNGRLILTIGQNIAISLHEQNKSRELVEGVQEALTALSDGTTQGIKDHVKKTKEMSEKNMGSSPEAMARAFSEAQKSLEEMAAMRSQALNKAKLAIKETEKLIEKVDAQMEIRHEQDTESLGEKMRGVGDKKSPSPMRYLRW